MRTWAAVALLLVGICAHASEAAPSRPRRRSHRWYKQKPKQKPKPKKFTPVRFKRLAPGRWRDAVSDSLEGVLERYGKDSEGYSTADPPVAVIRLDDAAITHHLGELIFYRLVTEVKFKFSEDFWSLVPQQYGRQRIRAGYEGFVGQPRKIWESDPYYRLYRKAFFRCYRELCREYGSGRCRLWIVQLLKGFDEREFRRFARDVIVDELKSPVRTELIEEIPEDPSPVPMRRGLRFIPEMKDLVRNLLERGIDVWTVSTSPVWAVEDLVKEYGIDPSRVVGMRTKVRDEILSAESLRPVPDGAGAAEMISMFIGRAPVLIVGGDEDDPMLGYGRGVRLKIVDPDKILPGFERRGPVVQPRFSAVRAPQDFAPARPRRPPEP